MERGTETDKKEKQHTLGIGKRRQVTVTGVTDVMSFDEAAVQLKTDCGELTLEGEGLHIGTLDMARGVVEVTGRVNGLYYSDGTPAPKGLRRLFG